MHPSLRGHAAIAGDHQPTGLHAKALGVACKGFCIGIYGGIARGNPVVRAPQPCFPYVDRFDLTSKLTEG